MACHNPAGKPDWTAKVAAGEWQEPRIKMMRYKRFIL